MRQKNSERTLTEHFPNSVKDKFLNSKSSAKTKQDKYNTTMPVLHSPTPINQRDNLKRSQKKEVTYRGTTI